MIRLPKSSPHAAPCRKACAEYGLGLMSVYPGNLRDDVRALSRLPEYRWDWHILTDATAKHYINNRGKSAFTAYQSGVFVNLSKLYRNEALVHRGFAYGHRCVTIYNKKWIVDDCAVGGTDAFCGCKRGELILKLACSYLSIEHTLWRMDMIKPPPLFSFEARGW